MKLIKYITFTAAVLFVAFFAVFYSSCAKKSSPDPCSGINCLNGGACNKGACVCPSGYTGTYCETLIDPCANITCHNGGTCNSGHCTCPTGTTGVYCDTIYRNQYANTYAGNGVDDGTPPYTYSNYKLVFITSGAILTGMSLTLKDATGTSVISSLPVTLSNTYSSSGTTYTIPTTVIAGSTYSGSGVVSESLASMTLREDYGGGTITYTFTNCVKQ